MPPTPRRPDGADTGGRQPIAVDVPSLEQAGRELAARGADLSTVSGSVRQKLADGLAAIPPSDLLRAYEYYTGRWSRQLGDAAAELRLAGDNTVRAGANYTDADHLPRPDRGPR